MGSSMEKFDGIGNGGGAVDRKQKLAYALGGFVLGVLLTAAVCLGAVSRLRRV